MPHLQEERYTHAHMCTGIYSIQIFQLDPVPVFLIGYKCTFSFVSAGHFYTSDTRSYMQLIHMCEGRGYFLFTAVWPLLRGNYKNVKPYLYCAETRSTRCHTFSQRRAARAFIRKPSCLFSPKTEIVFSLYFLRRLAEYTVCLDGKPD